VCPVCDVIPEARLHEASVCQEESPDRFGLIARGDGVCRVIDSARQNVRVGAIHLAFHEGARRIDLGVGSRGQSHPRSYRKAIRFIVLQSIFTEFGREKLAYSLCATPSTSSMRTRSGPSMNAYLTLPWKAVSISCVTFTPSLRIFSRASRRLSKL